MASSAALFGPSFACTNSDVSQRIFFGKSPPNNVHTDISSTFPSQAFLSVSNALTTKGAAYKLAPILASNKVFSGVTTKATTADAPAATESALVDVPPLLPQQKIRIKLRSYWTPRIQEAVRMILEAAKNTDAKIMGPVPLPTKRRLYCVLTSPHVDKDAREHFEIRTHRRLIDILNPTPRTIDALMQLDIPAGVDIEVLHAALVMPMLLDVGVDFKGSICSHQGNFDLLASRELDQGIWMLLLLSYKHKDKTMILKEESTDGRKYGRKKVHLDFGGQDDNYGTTVIDLNVHKDN